MLFSESFAAMVGDMLQAGGSRTLVTLPSYPAPFMLDIAERLTSLAAARHVHLELKIASNILFSWTEQERNTAETRGWNDTRGNLTYYRNRGSDGASLVVLCGVDKVTDTAGLEDFVFCDESYLWKTRKHLFDEWLKLRFAAAGLEKPEDEAMKKASELLDSLRSLPSGGLLRISRWLDNMDMSGISSGRELLLYLLDRLDIFGLPHCRGFAGKAGKKFIQYAKVAQSFFDYSSLFKSRDRAKARKAVETALDLFERHDRKMGDLEDRPEEICPSYASGQDFLKGLLQYITTENQEEREKLWECDFVFIHDVILRCRPTRTKTPRETPRRLYGPLLESVLSAIWYTMQASCKSPDFIRPGSLRLRGLSYEFMCEKDEKGLSVELCAPARERLTHLLDGVDRLLEKYLGEVPDMPEIRSRLLPDNPDDLKTQATRKTPSFCFEVEVAESAEAEVCFSMKYSWILPETHGDILNVKLLHYAAECIGERSDFPPVYHLPYYGELLTAPDDEDTREVLRHSLRDSENIAEALPYDYDGHDPLLPSLRHLARCYRDFVRYAVEKSLLCALFDEDAGGGSPWRDLKVAYEETLEKACQHTCEGTSSLGVLLMRAFLLLCPSSEQDRRIAGYEDSAVVTVLHPALLEQIQAQMTFLCAAFLHEYRKAIYKAAFPPAAWQRYLGLAKIHAPICTLLGAPDKRLVSELNGDGYVHKIGHMEHPVTYSLATRFLDGENRFEEKLSDIDLYAKSEESLLLDRLLRQYYDLRPQAWDGISLAVFRNSSVQPVIAGLHSFLRHLEQEQRLHANRRYDIRLIFFSKRADATALRTWLGHWQSRWDAARNEDEQSGNSCYRYCRISLAHRLTRQSQDIEDYIDKDHLNVDIALLYGILGMSEIYNRFVDVEKFDITKTELKFPILEKKYCSSRSEMDRLQRARIISLRQFSLGSRHTALIHALHNPNAHADDSLVVSTGNFNEWTRAISALHKAAEWVICVDPAMDEALIRDSAPEDHVRDIIAFGSGVGSHGEANYTISSEQLSCEDLRVHISERLAGLYGEQGPDKATCDRMVATLLKTERLAGMVLVRAASLRDEHIRDFLAYSLTRRLLHASEALCEAMISLDAYQHWFPPTGTEDERRPDLFWIRGEERSGRLHLRATLVECKLGQANDNVVWKGHAQLRSGLRRLLPLFQPCRDGELDDERPDRRYWWHQLHRVISSGLQANREVEARSIAGLLEQLAEGQFSIDWDALLLTYWTDDAGRNARWIESWDIDGVSAAHAVIGHPLHVRLTQDASEIWEDMLRERPEETGEESPLAESVDSGDTETAGGVDDEDMDEDDVSDWERDYQLSDSNASSDQERELADFLNHFEANVGADENQSESNAFNGRGGSTGQPPAAPDEPEPAEPNKPAHVEAPDVSVVPEHILLGTDKSGKKVYWNFRDAVNRHLVIFGSSGNGKTYAIQCILAELARQGLNTLVLDYSQSFAPNEILPPVRPYFPEERQHFVCNQPLPINPFTRQPVMLGSTLSRETPFIVADRITDIFKKVFDLGSQQVNILHAAICACLERHEVATLHEVENMLGLFLEDGEHPRKSLETLRPHIQKFGRLKPFADCRGKAGWEELYHVMPPCNHVFQFANIAPLSAGGMIEFVLWDLFFDAQRRGHPQNPSVVVLDEIQNLSMGDNSPLAKILREGRKFGMGLIAATQFLAGLKPAALSLLNQAACKLYFRPSDNEMADCGKLFHDVDPNCSAAEWKARLAGLGRGECYLVGPAKPGEPRVRFAKVSSMEERGFGN